MRLILMRHAKSDWSGAISDHDRPLNPRGVRAAERLGIWLRQYQYEPDCVLCSTATRTRETLAGLDVTAETHFLKDLYLAEPRAMLRGLQNAAGNCVLLIGHNPGIADLAEAILRQPPEHHRFFDFPTGATLVAELPIDDWSEISISTGVTVDFVVPKDLEQ